MTNLTAKTFDQFIEQSSSLDTTQSAPPSYQALEGFYCSLDSVTIPEIIGIWEGGCFNTGHKGEQMLRQMKWRGKGFHSTDDVNPLLVTPEASDSAKRGDLSVNNSMGKASLKMEEHQGVKTATMIYNNAPIYDHFRRINENTILGVMDTSRCDPPQRQELPLYFYLKRSNAKLV